MITVSDYYKNIFGQKVYKIAVDAGCTCPNRDGTLGHGGCIFCSQTGSGDFLPGRNLAIEEQIESAKALVESKFSRAAARGEKVSKKFIVYFQNFTNTYAGAGGDESHGQRADVSRHRPAPAGRLRAGGRRRCHAGHDHGGHHQQLVGDGIHELAEVGHQSPRAGDAPVQRVGDAGHGIDAHRHALGPQRVHPREDHEERPEHTDSSAPFSSGS